MKPFYTLKSDSSTLGGIDKKNEIYYNTLVSKKIPKLGVWNFLRWVLWLRLEYTSGNSKNWAQNQFDSRFRDFFVPLPMLPCLLAARNDGTRNQWYKRDLLQHRATSAAGRAISPPLF